MSKQVFRLSLLAAAACAAGLSLASSHREAPFITTSPKVDATDFYMFRSYEGVAPDGSGGRSDYVTLIANYQPLQDPYGGPELLHAGSERAVRDPHRQQRRRGRRPDVPVPLQQQAQRRVRCRSAARTSPFP